MTADAAAVSSTDAKPSDAVAAVGAVTATGVVAATVVEADQERSARSIDAGFIGAVLMDLDGTLVDTEGYWIAAEYALVAEHGGTWTDADARAIVGNALVDSAAYLREHGGVNLPSSQIVDQLSRSVVAALGESVPWRPGARELLAAARSAGVPCALVTMSYTDLVDTVVAQLPPDTFAAVITGDRVAHGKPHPEPYLTAAAALGLEPAHCVAVEDSPTGIASAEAAGCAVLAVPNQVSLPPGPRRVLRESLSGLNLAQLTELMAPLLPAARTPPRIPSG